jgi:hypothetical protein
MTLSLDDLSKAGMPENWLCIDCGANTAPGNLTRAELAGAFSVLSANKTPNLHFDEDTEIYTVRKTVWKAAGMEPMGGCLCIGCLENRLGRRLRPKDFQHGNGLNDPQLPGTPRLLDRRGD